MRITFRQLEIFVAVAKHGNISHAAKSLHLSQPAVTMQIKQLESLLKKPLIEVSGRQTLLTPMGKRVLLHAKTIQQATEELEHELVDDNQLKGKLRFAMPPMVAPEVVTLMGEFKKLHPYIIIETSVTPMNNTPEILLNNEVDLCFAPVTQHSNKTENTTLFSTKFYMLANQNHPLSKMPNLTIRDITDETFICPEQGSITDQLLDKISKEIYRKPNCIFINDHDTRKAAVRSGLGLAILPSVCIEEHDKDLVNLDVEGFPFNAEYCVMQLKSKRLPLVAKTFKEFLIKHYKQVDKIRIVK